MNRTRARQSQHEPLRERKSASNKENIENPRLCKTVPTLHCKARCVDRKKDGHEGWVTLAPRDYASNVSRHEASLELVSGRDLMDIANGWLDEVDDAVNHSCRASAIDDPSTVTCSIDQRSSLHQRAFVER